MLITVQSIVGGPGVTTFAAALASVSGSIYWDCDRYGSSVATWVGRTPLDPADHRNWKTMQQSWSADLKNPPLASHLTDIWGTKALVGDFEPQVQANTDIHRLALWAEQSQGDVVIADRGRAEDLIAASWRIIVCRPYRDQLWRTWAQFEKGGAVRSVWVLCGEERFNEREVTAKTLSTDWGLEHCYSLPWDKKLAAAIIKGKPPMRGAYRKTVTNIASAVGIKPN